MSYLHSPPTLLATMNEAISERRGTMTMMQREYTKFHRSHGSSLSASHLSTVQARGTNTSPKKNPCGVLPKYLEADFNLDSYSSIIARYVLVIPCSRGTLGKLTRVAHVVVYMAFPNCTK